MARDIPHALVILSLRIVPRGALLQHSLARSLWLCPRKFSVFVHLDTIPNTLYYPCNSKYCSRRLLGMRTALR